MIDSDPLAQHDSQTCLRNDVRCRTPPDEENIGHMDRLGHIGHINGWHIQAVSNEVDQQTERT